MSGFAGQLAAAIGDFFAPLQLALSSPTHMKVLLQELGFTIDDLTSQMPALQKVLPIAKQLDELTENAEKIEEGKAELRDLISSTIEISKDVMDAVHSLQNLSKSSLGGLAAPFDDPATWRELALRIPEHLLLAWLDVQHPLASATLILAGVIVPTNRKDGPRYTIEWDSLGNLISKPDDQIKSTYGWGSTFDHPRLLEALAGMARAVDYRPYLCELRPHLAYDYYADEEVPTDVRELSIRLLEGWTPDGSLYARIGLLLAPVPHDSTAAKPNAILLTTEILGEVTAKISLGGDWSIAFRGGADLTGALGLIIHPGGVALAASETPIEAGIELIGAPSTPWVLIGGSEETRLEMDGLRIAMQLQGTVSQPEFVLDMNTDGIRLVIALGEADGFLSDILGGEDLAISLDPSLQWSSQDGVKFGGSAGFEFTVPLDLTLGPVWIKEVRLALEGGTEGVNLECTTTGSIELGPFIMSAQDIGMLAKVEPREEGDARGTFGPVDVSVGFRPPTGIGIAIDASVVSGGGFLSIDSENGKYAGILAVDICGIGVTAIGLIATKLPDGSDGWSMFLSLSATFTGIQLGFGFTLNGVGGLVGVHRSMNVRALQDGLRTGALDSILFPEDPIRDAPKILSDLDAIFPPARGQFVFGPMAAIGWGTPTLVQAEVGIIIELPDPVIIAILGSIEAVLPTDEASVVELRMDILGIIDPAEGTIAIDATLRDSRVLTLALTGDMALRADFIGDVTLLLSFGGFNPGFSAPSGFPKMARLAVALDTGDNLRIQLGSYFAITSNTLQFGAAASLWAKALGLTVEGALDFDALIQYSPFGFVIGTGFYVSVSSGNTELLAVRLEGKLTGPNEWYVVGTATFKVLGLKKDLRIEAAFGDKKREKELQAIDVRKLLIDALADPECWTEQQVSSDGMPVLLGGTETEELRISPAGGLEVRQRVVPLRTKIEKYGNARVADKDYFELASPRIGTQSASESTSDIDDYFSPAQFLKMSDAEKLAAPSFEKMPSGLRFGSDSATAGVERPMVRDYEQIVLDPGTGSDTRADKTFAQPGSLLAGRLRNGAAARGRRAAGKSTSVRKSSPFSIGDSRFSVTSTATGKTVAGKSGNEKGLRWSEAREERRKGNRGRQIVPDSEVEVSK